MSEENISIISDEAKDSKESENVTTDCDLAAIGVTAGEEEKDLNQDLKLEGKSQASDNEKELNPNVQAQNVVDESCVSHLPAIVPVDDVGADSLTFRELKFEDLEQYKKLLKEFTHGFIGILFKEICDNKNGEFYAHGAFTPDNQLAGMIIGIRDYVAIRQFTDLETGLAAMTGKKLSHIIALIVDPKYRRNDIGKKLLEGFNKFIVDSNTATFLLIPHKNITAQQFFESQQFGALSTLRKFYNEFEDALLFVDKNSNRD